MIVMNVYRTKPGDLVVFRYPENGYESDTKRALELLTPGETYKVTEVRIRNWSTDVYLEGFTQAFNSVQFANTQSPEELQHREPNRNDDYYWSSSFGRENPG